MVLLQSAVYEIFLCNTICAFFIVAFLCVRPKNETGFPRSVRDAGNADTNYNLVKLLQAREHIPM